MNSVERIFNELCEIAKERPDVIALFLGGSRGKNIAGPNSDYDVYIIVKDEFVERYREMYLKDKYKGLDLMVFSLSEFENYGQMGTREEYVRYTFAHVDAIIDKNNKIQKLLEEKSRIPKASLSKFISSTLDEYINFFYRSLKCFRDANELAARIEAAGSIMPLLKAIFTIHNGRLMPYPKYLRWELETFPLNKIPFSSKKILDYVQKILDTADYRIQIKVLKVLEEVLRKEGYGYVFDSWGDEFIWMKNFQLEG